MYKNFEYENGLKLYYAKNNINKSTAVEVSFDCGSRCDNIPGLSHFCEHMFFTGTKTENKAAISKQYFDFIKVNAYTNTKEIFFTGEIFTSELKKYLNMIAKMINESTFSTKAVEDEKKVVVQEIVKDNDKFSKKASQLFSYLLFEKDYLKNGVLGSTKSVNQITSKDVKAYIKKYFVSNNCRVYICSPLSFSKVKKMVATCLGDKLKTNKKLEELSFDDYSTTQTCKFVSKKVKLDKNYLTISFRLPHDKIELRNLNIMGMICDVMQDISDGVTKYLRLQNNLVYFADVYHHVTEKDLTLIFRTECSKENIKSCIDVFCEYVGKLLKEGISLENINKQKRHAKYYHVTAVARPTSRINNMVYSRRYGKVITGKTDYKVYQSVKLDEVNNTLKQIFKNPTFVCSIYGDAEKTDFYNLSELKTKFNNLI